MMVKRWARVGPKSGPANILDGRWEVYGGRSGHGWAVRHLESGIVVAEGIPTMRAARAEAIRIADAGWEMQRCSTLVAARAAAERHGFDPSIVQLVEGRLVVELSAILQAPPAPST